jgi:hypothetical protein
MKISEHLTLAELTTSQTATRLGINNTAPAFVIENLKAVSENVFEPIREHFNVPIRISSGYRSKELNKAIKGSPTSQHVNGQALDLQGTNGLTNALIFEFIKKNLEYDQLIWEYGNKTEPAWVHVSYSKLKNRKQILYIGVK